jgi:hypothetical protein
MSLLKSNRKLFTVFTLGLIMSLIGIIPVYAYNLTGYKWPSSTIKYYYDNYNSSRGKSYISSGASAWNGTDATYSFNASYNIYASEVSMPNVEWDGLTQGTASGSYYNSLTISLNMAKTQTWNSDGALKSVSVHEFGHGLGLHENGTTKTIMNAYTWGTNSRYGGYGLTTPQTDDINGANSIY